jgi:hypothetical protein
MVGMMNGGKLSNSSIIDVRELWITYGGKDFDYKTGKENTDVADK